METTKTDVGKTLLGNVKYLQLTYILSILCCFNSTHAHL